jgi:hypothetical protein
VNFFVGWDGVDDSGDFSAMADGRCHVSVEALLYAVGCEVIICGFVVPAHELTWRWEELRVHVIWTMRR